MEPKSSEIVEPPEIVEIRKRRARITEPPWKAHYRVSPRGAYRQWHIGNRDGLCQITMGGQERDYYFMAHAPTDIDFLLTAYTAVQQENKQLRWECTSAKESEEAMLDAGMEQSRQFAAALADAWDQAAAIIRGLKCDSNYSGDWQNGFEQAQLEGLQGLKMAKTKDTSTEQDQD